MSHTSYNNIELSSGDLWEGVDFAVEKVIKTKRFKIIHPGHRMIVNLHGPRYSYVKHRGRWKQYHYGTGSMGLVPYGEVNEFKVAKDVRYISMSLHLSFLEKLFDVGKIRLREQRGVYDPTVHLLVMDLQKELLDPHFVGRIYAESLIHTLTLHLASFYPDGKNKIVFPKGRLTSIQLKRVIDYCHGSLGDNPGLSDLADQANLSPFHFARLFRQSIGYSPYQYLQQLKIEAAKKRIRSGKGSLTEIAYELGFSDQAHFCNAFRRATGISPRRF